MFDWMYTFALFSEVKRRKRHRRKHVENQEPCIMRGVYFKNLKWQAAIKVDKKQIHLGTVGSQEEAARLYDRYYYRLFPLPSVVEIIYSEFCGCIILKFASFH